MADTSLVFNILAKDRASKTFDRLKASVTAFAAVAGAAVVGFGISAISAGSDLAETQSKVNVIFGESAGAVFKFAQGADRALGQSKQQALDAAATFATFGKSAGLSGDQLVGFSTDMTKLASDLASFNNTTPEQAIEAIGAALRGESEPIRAYGVLLDDATLRNEALRLGLVKTTTEALTPQQKVLAAQSAIMKQTTAAQGDFARTSDGLANRQRIMRAELANVQATIGEKLLPVALKLTTWGKDAIDWMTKHKDVVIPLVAVLGTLAGIIAVIIGVYKLWTIAQTALNIVMMLNPIGLIVLGIMILVGVIVLIATKTTWFQDLWRVVWGGIKAAAEAVGRWFTGTLWPWMRGVFDSIRGAVTGARDWVVGRFNDVVGFIAGLPGRIGNAASGMFDGIRNAFRGAINWIISKWNNLSFSIPSVNIPGLGRVGGATLSTPNIPLLAAGGRINRSGLAVVGERGPELVSLSRGAQVSPLGRTGPVVNVYVQGSIRSDRDIVALIRDEFIRGGFRGLVAT